MDRTKEKLRKFRNGELSALPSDALEVLAGYALLEGVLPADPGIRAIVDATLEHWENEWGLEVVLQGPERSTADLIRRRDAAGNTIDGWLDMCARDAGRPKLLGYKRLSSVALFDAIHVLAPYCPYRPRAHSGDQVSPAARYFYQCIVGFEPNVTLQDIATVLHASRSSLPR